MDTTARADDPAQRSAADVAARVVRPEIRALTAYPVAKAAGMIKLDAMESPFGLSEPLRAKLAAALAAVPVNRYPDGGADAVKAALRDAFAIPAELGVLVGNGSDELIQIITSALARPGAVMLAPEPSFVMYARNALYTGMRFVGVPLNEDFSIDVRAMLDAIARSQPTLVYLAYPNNPTGNLFDAADVERIVRASPGLAVVDEAYHAFAEATLKSERARLEAAIAQLPGVTVFPTRTNFVLARVPDAPRWFDALARAGLLVKNLHGWHPLLAHCLRITVGSPAENDALLAALKAIR